MYETILVPLDGSRRAERILAHVLPLAQHFGAKIVLLRVIEPDLIILRTQSASAEFNAQMSEQWEAEAASYLAGIQGELRATGLQVRTVVERGPVARTIIEVAAREAVDLVAMASHGRSGLKRAFYGSVAAGVLRRVDRPLLVIRADEG
jgi:nucleotide-binding universal stress UspA family protein